MRSKPLNHGLTSYFLDGRADQQIDFRGNIAKQLWHICCGRLQASIQRDGTSATISNTDFYGNVTHTASVQNFDASAVDYHNPTDAAYNSGCANHSPGAARRAYVKTQVTFSSFRKCNRNQEKFDQVFNDSYQRCKTNPF